jgi:hypothetical protein
MRSPALTRYSDGEARSLPPIAEERFLQLYDAACQHPLASVDHGDYAEITAAMWMQLTPTLSLSLAALAYLRNGPQLTLATVTLSKSLHAAGACVRAGVLLTSRLLGFSMIPSLPWEAAKRAILRRLLAVDVFAFMARRTAARTAALAATDGVSEQRRERQWREAAGDAHATIGYLLHVTAYSLPFGLPDLVGAVLASLRSTAFLQHGALALVGLMLQRQLSAEVGGVRRQAVRCPAEPADAAATPCACGSAVLGALEAPPRPSAAVSWQGQTGSGSGSGSDWVN